MKLILSLSGSLLLIAAFVAVHERTNAYAQDAPSAKPSVASVEKDMHEFMEYVFEPTYNRLKAHMATEPADTPAWKGIKSDSLILAESGNLLLGRLPEEGGADWMQFSVQVRDLGGQLYQAAKKKDYRSARQHYTTMLTKCNACHEKFAGGEHQLAP